MVGGLQFNQLVLKDSQSFIISYYNFLLQFNQLVLKVRIDVIDRIIYGRLQFNQLVLKGVSWSRSVSATNPVAV